MRRAERRFPLGLALRIAGASLLAGIGVARALAGTPVQALFDDGTVRDVVLSPSARWVVVRNEDPHALLVRRLADAPLEAALRYEDEIRALRWLDGDRFVLRFADTATRRAQLITLVDQDDRIEAEARPLPETGWLVDPLIREPGVILWAYEDSGSTHVRRTSLEDALRYDPRWRRQSAGREKKVLRRVRLGDPVARVKGAASDFVVDARGAVRAALRQEDDVTTLLYRDPGDEAFRELARFADEAERIEPRAMKPGSDALLVLARGARGRVALYELDTSERFHATLPDESGRSRLSALVFGRDDADVSEVLVDDATGELMGVVFEVDEVPRRHFFDAYRNRYLGHRSPGQGDRDVLPRQVRGPHVALTSTSIDHTTFVLWRSGPSDPGSHYLYHRPTGELTLLAAQRPGLDRSALHDVEVLEATSRDGTRIRASLALPRFPEPRPAPLVVLPYADPFSVPEEPGFDPLQHTLAGLGLAVLEVAYRSGSAPRGSGSAPRGSDAARRPGGRPRTRAIQEDLDAAIDRAVERPEVDGTRICAVGVGYGGYAALVSALRHPERFRCAVSMNGVTDVPFQFESGTFEGDDDPAERLVELFGDPERDLPALVERSPVFRARALRTPLLLLYGTEDRRVDPDHAFRLMAMLDLYRRPYAHHSVEGAGHDFTATEWQEVTRVLASFLTEDLTGEPGSAGGAPGDRLGSGS